MSCTPLERDDFKISNEGRSLFKFLTGRGRIGRRFATRFWETESSLGRERELLIIACKKWHVAKRLLTAQSASIRMCLRLTISLTKKTRDLPDLGGIQSNLGKRTRHRRALMRMLFDYYDTNRLVICLDTANLDLMQDFFSDRSTTRLLEIDCDMTDDYLCGHARRVGLAGDQTSDETLAQLLPTIRYDDVCLIATGSATLDLRITCVCANPRARRKTPLHLRDSWSLDDETARNWPKPPTYLLTEVTHAI